MSWLATCRSSVRGPTAIVKIAAFNPAIKPADIKLGPTFDNSYAQKALDLSAYKGQTIRVPPVPTLVEVMKAFGANPVPMIWGEVYMAVRQGTGDGLELPGALRRGRLRRIRRQLDLGRFLAPPGRARDLRGPRGACSRRQRPRRATGPTSGACR